MINQLYAKCKRENNYFDAQLILKNLLSKDIGNKKLFEEFVDISLEIAMFDMVFDERKQYVNEANSALSLFSESAELDEETLINIKETRDRINLTFQAICKAEHVFYESELRTVRDENGKLMNELATINEQLRQAASQEDFDSLLANVAEIENRINKDVFSEIQGQIYDSLTKSYSKTISSKMEELNYNGLLSLNKKAVACFKEVFDSFVKNKEKYRDSEGNLRALMTSNFFIFNTSKLFNESLVYYNHVYTTIFQEVSDDLKFKLTEWAIRTAKLDKWGETNDC